MIQKKFVVFTASSFLFLIVFFTTFLIVSQDDSNQPQAINTNRLALISAIDV